VRGTQHPVETRGSGSRNLPEIPRLRADLRVRFDNGRCFVAGEEQVQARLRHVDDDLHEAMTPESWITTLSADVRVGLLTATAGVTNLFDRADVEHLSFQRDPFRSGVRVARAWTPGLRRRRVAVLTAWARGQRWLLGRLLDPAVGPVGECVARRHQGPSMRSLPGCS
jgi:hypothetical protein